MIINEIDLDSTSNRVEIELTQIKNQLESGLINKSQAIEKAEELSKQIIFEIELSDLTEFEKSQYMHLILAIKLFIKKYIISS